MRACISTGPESGSAVQQLRAGLQSLVTSSLRQAAAAADRAPASPSRSPRSTQRVTLGACFILTQCRHPSFLGGVTGWSHGPPLRGPSTSLSHNVQAMSSGTWCPTFYGLTDIMCKGPFLGPGQSKIMSSPPAPTEAKRRVQERKAEKREEVGREMTSAPPPLPAIPLPLAKGSQSPSPQTAHLPMFLDEGHLGAGPRAEPPGSHGRRPDKRRLLPGFPLTRR